VLDCIEWFFYAHVCGEWESLTRWPWLDGHVTILLATALAGYSVAEGASLRAALLVPFPLVYLYERHEKAKTYRVRSDTSG
jgi:hypothetical protein